jgi:hypothetical protein
MSRLSIPPGLDVPVAPYDSFPVRFRFAAILLASWFAVLGTGAAEYLHNLEHAAPDTPVGVSRSANADADDQSSPASPLPDDNNCDVHAQLHLPLMAAHWTPPLELLAGSAPLAREIVESLISTRVPARIDCRGPPVSSVASHLLTA